MVGRASPVLGPRALAFAALLAALLAYYLVRERLPDIGLWWDVLLIAFVLMPAVFALVLLVLPLHGSRVVPPAAIVAFTLGAAVAEIAGLGTIANFAKLGAATAVGFWFLTYFETLSWVVLVAFVVPWVDAYSVWRGPTREIVTHHEGVFSALSFAFPVPDRGSAQLGLPDLLFFALFLAAAARFDLRPRWTWLGLVAGLAGTVLLATWQDVGGLPALPLLAAGFLVPNADLLWTRLRRPPGGDQRP